MKKNDLQRFCRAIVKFLADKPKGKWTAFAHVWDRGIVAGLGIVTFVTASVTNNTGMLLLILWSLAILGFGLYLVSKGR